MVVTADVKISPKESAAATYTGTMARPIILETESHLSPKPHNLPSKKYLSESSGEKTLMAQKYKARENRANTSATIIRKNPINIIKAINRFTDRLSASFIDQRFAPVISLYLSILNTPYA